MQRAQLRGELVRDVGVAIVEHQHFTPERIRRFVTDRLDQLVAAVLETTPAEQLHRAILGAVEQELATPTEQMATSFAALEEHHRALLVALLDAPAGLIDERELAETLRRHHPGGLSRPPHELIDRLTDHFLRISSLGIGWVHPSWRDLVIEQLRSDRDARRRFLAACGTYGALLVLSGAGGAGGERVLPLLIDDADWDVFTDRIGGLLRELDDADLARLLLACAEPLAADLEVRQTAELQSLVEYTLGATRRFWGAQRTPLPIYLLESWYTARRSLARPLEAPRIDTTWAALHPASVDVIDEQRDMRRSDEWLELAQTLRRHDPPTLETLGFPDTDAVWLRRLGQKATQLTYSREPDRSALAMQILARLNDLLPQSAIWADVMPARSSPTEDRWWTPQDIDATPTTERVTPTPEVLTHDEIDKVLSDL